MRDQNLLGNKQKNNRFFRLISGNKIKQRKRRDWVWIFSLLMSNLIWIMKIKEKRIFLNQQ
ncbi:unnamed protein product [Paramecium primaurelia]|uniref:Uncharacterized protein n=1 Tax=Paramecium primaurelia TaxID=5886 RepID=A0A8S1QVC3_PARPR|nr:unnamed protein product [Paramecium primaurelia]